MGLRHTEQLAVLGWLISASVEGNWQPNTTLVSFEDLYDPSGRSSNFNDLSFSFSNTAILMGSTKM
jgi:hypothetical protein